MSNNEEIIEFMRLEALVRVYLAPEGEGMRFTIEAKIAQKLADLDQLRGYKFDTKASAAEFLDQFNKEAPQLCEGCGHELGTDKVIVPADDMSPEIALCPECAKKDEIYTTEGFASEHIDKS